MSDGNPNAFWRNNEYLFLLLGVSLVAQLGVVGAMIYSGRIALPHTPRAAANVAGAARTSTGETEAPGGPAGAAPPNGDTATAPITSAASSDRAREMARAENLANGGHEAPRAEAALTAAPASASGGEATPAPDTSASMASSTPSVPPATSTAIGTPSAVTASAPSPVSVPAGSTSGQTAGGTEPKGLAPTADAAPPLVAKADPASEPTAPAAKEPAPNGAARMEQLLGPVQQSLTPEAAAARATAVSYRRSVLSQLSRAKRAGTWQGQPGTAAVHFVLGSKGEVLTCEVVRKSSDPALNAEAIAMVRRGAPYPPPPPEAKRDFTIGLRFEPST